MAISYVNAGSATLVTVTVTPLAVPYPATVTSGNLLILAVDNKYSDAFPNTPSGWTLQKNETGGIGAPGNDAGTVNLYVYTKESDGTETGNVTVNFSGTMNTAGGNIFQYSKSAGSWNLGAVSGIDGSASALWVVSGTANPGVETGDMVLAIMAQNGNLSLTWSGQKMTQTGVTFGTAVERFDDDTTSGTDHGMMMSEHPVSTGTGSANPVFSMSGTGSGATGPTGPGIILRLRQVSGSTYESSLSLSRSDAISDSGILTLPGLLSMNTVRAVTESNIMDMSAGVTLTSSKAVLDGNTLDLQGIQSYLKILGINNVGGLEFQSSVSLNRNDTVSTSYVLSIESLLAIDKFLSVLQSSNLDINSLLSVSKTLNMSLSTLVDMLGFISLSYSKSISQNNVVTLGGILDGLQKMLGISQISGTVFDGTISLQKSLFVSLLSGLAFSSAISLAKSLSISLDSDRTVVASISLSESLGVSEQATAELLGNLPVSMRLGIGSNALADVLAQINLSNTRNINLLSGQNVDVSLLISKILSIVSNGAVGVVVFPGMVIIIDREIVSTSARTIAINLSDSEENLPLYQVSISDKPA